MIKLVLLRHGESLGNKENWFQGWLDADLTEKGRYEAKKAGETLKNGGFIFDVVFTSVLKRAIRTVWIVLDEMDLMWIPVYKSWKLNERHYGALQGLNKSETALKYGEEQVLIWRRSYAIRPPKLERSNPGYPGNDRRYDGLADEELPLTESLKDTVDRLIPYWKDTIAPAVRSGKRVIIVAHGNSLRALIKYLDNLSDQDISGLNIPTGIPLVYELTDDLKPVKSYYLGSLEETKKATEAVANQGKVRRTV